MSKVDHRNTVSAGSPHNMLFISVGEHGIGKINYGNGHYMPLNLHSLWGHTVHVSLTN